MTRHGPVLKDRLLQHYRQEGEVSITDIEETSEREESTRHRRAIALDNHYLPTKFFADNPVKSAASQPTGWVLQGGAAVKAATETLQGIVQRTSHWYFTSKVTSNQATSKI
jgi:hypothetical protein